MGDDSCSSSNVLVQAANSASPVIIRTGTLNNIASQNAVQQSVTPSAGTMHVECVPMSAAGISVVPQPVGGGAAPSQQIRLLQAASAQPQVVHQPQQYQVIQQQPQQLGATPGGTGITLIQTASGQLVLQQPQVLKSTDHAAGSQPQLVIDSSSQTQVNYGNVQGVQLAGGIQIQSAVAAQPVVLQQQSVTPSNRNIIVQTLPVVSAANSAAASNIIQLGHLSSGGGGATVTHQTHHVTRLNQPSQPTSNQSTDQNGVLVQIGGQTYRMQGVQQVQVGNAVRPVQRFVTPAATTQPTLAQPRPTNSATPSQPLGATRQLTPVTPGKPTSVTVPGQTITLTPSQMTLLKQTPPEKQLAMVQLFQRQMAQRSVNHSAASSGVNSPGSSPVKTVQIVQNSVTSSAALQRPSLTTQTARFSAPTIIRAGPPITVRVGQNPSSATAGNTQSVGLQVLRPKPTGEMNSSHSAVIGKCCLLQL